MKNSVSLTLARVLGLLAVASLPGFVWFGWWHLGVSIGLAGAAVLAYPSHDRRTASRLRQRLTSLGWRIRPHAWRPGRR